MFDKPPLCACFVTPNNNDDGLFLFFAFYSLKTNNSIRYMTTESLQSDYSKDWFNLMKLCYSHATHKSENINCILKHKNFSMQHVIDNPDLPWDWDLINTHEKLTLNHVKQNLTLPWNLGCLSYRTNVNEILNNLELPWDWNTVSARVTNINIIENNPDFPWNVESIRGELITIDFILKMNAKQKLTKLSAVSGNPKIKMEDILNNLDLPWDWRNVGLNKSITIEDIMNHSELPWDWSIICNKQDGNGRYVVSQPMIISNSHLPWKTNMLQPHIEKPFSFKLVLENPDADWNWKWLHGCSDLTMEHILQFSDKDWSWYMLSRNHNFSSDIFLKLPDKNWDWKYLSGYGRDKVPFDVILKLPDKDWDWNSLSNDPNLPIKCVLELKDKPWDWRGIMRNKSFN